jgi:transposase
MNNDRTYDLSKGPKVEVITQAQRRRRWSAIEKKQIIEETYQPGHSVSYVARKHGISPAQLFNWKRVMEQGGLTAVGKEEAVVAESELKKAHDRIRRLERLLGMKTEEVEVLKEAVRIGREKKLISRKPLVGIEDFE